MKIYGSGSLTYIHTINRFRRYCFTVSSVPNLLSLDTKVLRPPIFNFSSTEALIKEDSGGRNRTSTGMEERFQKYIKREAHIDTGLEKSNIPVTSIT